MEDLLIITESGQLLYSWHREGNITDDDLISGFLTALNTFATHERGEDITSLKLRETTLIFEKVEDYQTKLVFVITTKDEELINLLHTFVHEIIDMFSEMFKDLLNKEFNGNVTKYRSFSEELNKLIINYGLDVLDDYINQIDEISNLKSVTFLNPENGQILYLYSKQYLNKENLSYLVPLVQKSADMFFNSSFDEKIDQISIETIRTERLVLEKRKKILIIIQYKYNKNYESQYISLDLIKNEEKYVKNKKKLTKIFESVIWDDNVKQIYLIDLLGEVIFKKITENSLNYQEYIPAIISFITSSKKLSEGVYNHNLFYCSIKGAKIVTFISLNFNRFFLILYSEYQNIRDFQSIQSLCLNIVNQLK
ncbi:MAG: hypothetical protein ACFFAO_11440 [Candidatus Hermodarchaeota archaeon]